MVVTRIEADAQDIARRKAVAAPQRRDDLRGVLREALHGHVQIAIVERDLHHRSLRRRLHVVGLVLHQVIDERRLRPHLVVYPAVEPGQRAVDPVGAQLLAHFFRHIGFVKRGGRLSTLSCACASRGHKHADRQQSRQNPGE